MAHRPPDDVDGSDEILDGWHGGPSPEPRPGGVVSTVGINQERPPLAVDPEATASARRSVGPRSGTAVTVERLGPPDDPAMPRPSGRLRLKRQ